MYRKTSKISEYISKTSQLYRIRREESVFGTSRNIKRPKVYKTTYRKAKEKIKNGYFVKEKTYLVVDETTGKIINKHKTETYEKDDM